MKNSKLLATGLIVIALTPWTFGAFDVVTSNFNIGTVEASLYDQLRQGAEGMSNWKVYWHLVVLAGFIIELFLTERIQFGRKFSWLFGLLLFWPIVSVFFVCRTILTNGSEKLLDR